MSGQMAELKDINDSYVQDTRFNNLRRSGINFVGGSGPLNPQVMIVGAAPGSMENDKKMPFIGRVGSLLEGFLKDRDVNINPRNVYLTNVLKYWPQDPLNPDREREITKEEMEASREYLLQEIEAVDPMIVGLCGLTAIRAIYPE